MPKHIIVKLLGFVKKFSQEKAVRRKVIAAAFGKQQNAHKNCKNNYPQGIEILGNIWYNRKKLV